MNISQLFVFSLFLTSSIFNSANAQLTNQQGQVNMYGEILESACTIGLNSIDQTIDMGNIPIDSIRNENNENSKEFEIKLIDCRWGAETQNNLTDIDISFTGRSESDYFLVNGDAQGIMLGLESSSGRKITPNETLVFEHNFSTEALSRYRFKLLQDGKQLKPGFFNTIVYFNISYK